MGQNFEWLKAYKSNTTPLEVTGVYAETNGESVVMVATAGNKADSIVFGKFTLYKNNTYFNNYLLRVDSNGNITNAQFIGTYDAYGLCSDGKGNYYTTGYISDSSTSALVGNKTLSYQNGTIIFANYDKNFNLTWFNQTGNARHNNLFRNSYAYYNSWHSPKLIFSNQHLYFYTTTISSAKIGSKNYTFKAESTYIFGELNSTNGSIIWSNYFSDSFRLNFQLNDFVFLKSKLYFVGGYGSGRIHKTLLNGDTLNNSFLIETDSVGKYLKSFSITGNFPIHLNCLTTDGKHLYVGGSFIDTIKIGKNKISPHFSSIRYFNESNKRELFVASLTTDFKFRWFYHPQLVDTSAQGYNFINVGKSDGGFLYFVGGLTNSIIIGKDTIISKKWNGAHNYHTIFLLKMDSLSNILWAASGGKNNYQGYPEAISIIKERSVFIGGFFSGSISLGKFQENSTYQAGFLTKITDYSISRGQVSAGPYCAGDTIKVPYKLVGVFDTSNVFIAELSNEQGNFESGDRELGRLKSNKDGTIKGVLPLFNVASSPYYRIRIRSSSPKIQSYYILDTLRLLIYSRDKANPGLPETICMGDSLKLNTYGGTKWTWSPKYRMDDPTKRQPIVWPTKDTTYRIIIADSSGCGEPDTAFKKVHIRAYPKSILKFNDTVVCGIGSLKVPISFVGGDSNFKWQWHFVYSPKSWFPSVTGQNKLLDTLNYQPNDPNEKLAIILKDGCTSKPDTAYLTINQRQKVTIKSTYKDTSLCSGHKLKYIAIVTGGVPKYLKYQWKDLITNSILSNTDSLAFTTNKTEKIQLIVNDGCEALGDTAIFNVTVKPPLKSISNLRDTTVCAGQTINYTAQATGGDDKNYSYSWVLDGKQISTSNNLNLKSDILNLNSNLTLITKDNCSVPNDSISKSITVKPAPFANFTYDLACSRTPTNFTFTGTKPKSPITTTFNWDFNKESTSTLEHPSLLFSAAGIKRVKLTALASNGCVDTLTQDINVKPQSQADFTVDDVCESDSAVFINKSKDATGYNWKFGDGLASGKMKPKHKYQIPSTTTFNVTLVAIVKDGCSDSISKPLTINESPSSDFSITKVNQNVDVKANKNGLSTYKWVRIWKDGSKDSTTKTTNVHNYTYHENLKTICLTATDNLGCQSQTCKDASSASSKSINANKIKIYPNPASETITVEIPTDNQEYTIQLINSLGQVVMQQTAIQHSTFNIQHLSEGVYLVRIKNGEMVWNQRVIIARN